MASMIKRLIE